MANTDFKSVTQYLATQPKAAQTVLKKVRALIRKTLPKAQEAISYQIPTYKVQGEMVIYFAGWKEHFSLYPATGLVEEVLGAKLEPYKVSKGTLRFPFNDPLPVKLIERIVKLRAKDALARAKAKAKR